MRNSAGCGGDCGCEKCWAENDANFVSEQQRRFLFSQHPDIAHSWAHGEHTAEEDHRMPPGPGKDVKGPMAKAARKRKRTANRAVPLGRSKMSDAERADMDRPWRKGQHMANLVDNLRPGQVGRAVTVDGERKYLVGNEQDCLDECDEDDEDCMEECEKDTRNCGGLGGPPGPCPGGKSGDIAGAHAASLEAGEKASRYPTAKNLKAAADAHDELADQHEVVADAHEKAGNSYRADDHRETAHAMRSTADDYRKRVTNARRQDLDDDDDNDEELEDNEGGFWADAVRRSGNRGVAGGAAAGGGGGGSGAGVPGGGGGSAAPSGSGGGGGSSAGESSSPYDSGGTPSTVRVAGPGSTPARQPRKVSEGGAASGVGGGTDNEVGAGGRAWGGGGTTVTGKDLGDYGGGDSRKYASEGGGTQGTTPIPSATKTSTLRPVEMNPNKPGGPKMPKEDVGGNPPAPGFKVKDQLEENEGVEEEVRKRIRNQEGDDLQPRHPRSKQFQGKPHNAAKRGYHDDAGAPAQLQGDRDPSDDGRNTDRIRPQGRGKAVEANEPDDHDDGAVEEGWEDMHRDGAGGETVDKGHGGSGKIKPTPRTSKMPTSNAFPPQFAPPDPAHDASKSAAAASLQTEHADAFGHAKDALDHSADDNSPDAAKSHGFAAKQHDGAAHDSREDGDEQGASDHEQAAMLHRKAASMHRLTRNANPEGINQWTKGRDARGRTVHKATSDSGTNYLITEMKSPGDVIHSTGLPSTHVLSFQPKGGYKQSALHSSLEDAQADAEGHAKKGGKITKNDAACPKCGGQMIGGECRKCGYEANCAMNEGKRTTGKCAKCGATMKDGKCIRCGGTKALTQEIGQQAHEVGSDQLDARGHTSNVINDLCEQLTANELEINCGGKGGTRGPCKGGKSTAKAQAASKAALGKKTFGGKKGGAQDQFGHRDAAWAHENAAEEHEKLAAGSKNKAVQMFHEGQAATHRKAQQMHEIARDTLGVRPSKVANKLEDSMIHNTWTDEARAASAAARAASGKARAATKKTDNKDARGASWEASHHSGQTGEDQEAPDYARSSSHEKAASFHEMAAKNHEDAGETGEAKLHATAAEAHRSARKLTNNRRIETMTRGQKLRVLTRNCRCETDVAALNAMSDEGLTALIANAKAEGSNADTTGSKKPAVAGGYDEEQQAGDGTEWEDETVEGADDTEVGDDEVDPDRKLAGAGKDVTKNALEWCRRQGAPAAVQNALVAQIKQERNAKAALCRKLIANVEGDAQRRSQFSWLMQQSPATLRRMTKMVPAQNARAYAPDFNDLLEPTYVGQAGFGGPDVLNFSASEDRSGEDVLDVPTMSSVKETA